MPKNNVLITIGIPSAIESRFLIMSFMCSDRWNRHDTEWVSS